MLNSYRISGGCCFLTLKVLKRIHFMVKNINNRLFCCVFRKFIVPLSRFKKDNFMDLEYYFKYENGFSKFLYQWMDLGAMVEGDMYKFFCYFTVFNFLYNYYRDDDCDNCNLKENQNEQCMALRGINTLPQRAIGEQCMIYKTINSVLKDGEFNPFGDILTEESEIIKKPVRSMMKGKLAKKVDYNDTSVLNIQKLFLNIYYVRCNLYHGSKAMDCGRDIALVKESAKVLEKFLKYVIEKYSK